MPQDPDYILNLWREYQSHRSLTIRNRLIERYVFLAEMMARKLHRQFGEGEYEDFRSAGLIGLIDAVEKFDPDRGLRFSTYSTLRIRGSIIDDLRKQTWLPRCARRRVKEWTEAEEHIAATTGRTPSEEEVATTLNVAPTQFRAERRALAAQTHSMDAYGPSDDEKQELFSQSSEVDPFDRASVRDEVDHILARLGPRHRELVELRYLKDLPFCDVGAAAGTSESCASSTVGYVRRSLKKQLLKQAA